MVSKGFASFIRVIGCLVAAIQIIATIHTAEYSYDSNTWGTLASLASAFVTLALAFSYAKLIDTTLANVEDIRWMKESLEKQVTSQQKQVSVQPIPDPERPGHVTCPCCRESQQDGRVRCLNCGIPFVTYKSSIM